MFMHQFLSFQFKKNVREGWFPGRLGFLSIPMLYRTAHLSLNQNLEVSGTSVAVLPIRAEVAAASTI